MTTNLKLLVPLLLAALLLVVGQAVGASGRAGDVANAYFAAGRFAAGVFGAGDFALDVFAAGIFSAGIFSVGVFSIGVFSVGVHPVGVFAFGPPCARADRAWGARQGVARQPHRRRLERPLRRLNLVGRIGPPPEPARPGSVAAGIRLRINRPRLPACP